MELHYFGSESLISERSIAFLLQLSAFIPQPISDFGVL